MHIVINLDKPKGITSQDAVTRVKRILKVKKAGHAGTLDPIATGVLIVCTGEATKIAGYLAGLEKQYVATLKLGERTDTLDAEGKVLWRAEEVSVTAGDIEGVLGRFRGEISQTPPMYSALKVSGKPLYELARKGLTVERQPRTVHISGLSLLEFSSPFVTLDIVCSKGTYIRSLAEDIGLALGTGAHVTELRRLRIGDFTAHDAARLEELPGKPSALRSIDSALGHLGEVLLNEREFRLASHGAAIERGGLKSGLRLRLKGPDGKLFALGTSSEKEIKIDRLLHI